MFKRILGLALMGMALTLAACASPSRESTMTVAQGYGIPTYGYAAQYYAPPRPPCCRQAPAPCCVQAAPPCCMQAAYAPPPCNTCSGALTLGPEFAYDGGVGPIPEGGYGGGGYVIVGGGSGAGSAASAGGSARASASASASASSAVSIHIGGGGRGHHGGGKPSGCGGGCGH